MSWGSLQVSGDGTHHVDEHGVPAYAGRFDEVLKFHEPGLAPVRLGARAWHIWTDGSPAYAERFARTFGYYEGQAAVVGLGGWHHITAAGADAYPERYAWCGNFQQGRCPVRLDDGSYHHVRSDGRPAYDQRWRYAGDYRDGVAVVQASDGRSTHVDLEGVLVHAGWFLDLDVFHKGYARARDEGGWVHVDASGRPVYTRRFAAVEPFYNSQARVERFDGGLEVIDEAGATIVELRPALRSEFAALSGDMVGFWRTQTIAAAVEIGVPAVLPATEAELADRCGLRLEGAHRLVRALGELGLVIQDDGRWALSSRGEYLHPEHPLTLADAALEYAGPFSRMWAQLSDALRPGSGWTAPDVFAEVARDEGRREGHHRMLRSYARHDYAQVCRALDLRGDERIVDAGGGLGVLGQLVLDAYPGTQVTVLERPEVVAQGAASTGLRWRSGDLFEPWGLEADAVVLSRVLHDWDDDAARRVLAHARACLPTGGRLYIVEMLMREGSVTGALCDLHLLVATGGRERTLDEFGRLLATSGFALEGVRRLAALPSVIVGVAA
jgi:hypothetical protein